MGPGCRVISDMNVLFQDPARGDFRRKPGGPAPDVGATIRPRRVSPPGEQGSENRGQGPSPCHKSTHESGNRCRV